MIGLSVTLGLVVCSAVGLCLAYILKRLRMVARHELLTAETPPAPNEPLVLEDSINQMPAGPASSAWPSSRTVWPGPGSRVDASRSR